MLRVRPGVLLVRASFAPTSELLTRDFPTFDRPRNAISGTPGAGKWVRSLADSINRARIRIQTVSSVWVAHGKRRRKKKLEKKWEEETKLFVGKTKTKPAPESAYRQFPVFGLRMASAAGRISSQKCVSENRT